VAKYLLIMLATIPLTVISLYCNDKNNFRTSPGTNRIFGKRLNITWIIPLFILCSFFNVLILKLFSLIENIYSPMKIGRITQNDAI